ncbi:MAG: bacillithiol system redox-active protein YtxJ [Bacteroidetes bacterium]|jgi:bacillithiol system protein YtxJ|nr:bacillithiol system redox-active protein YtxJ [Bacteroidota bacterium]MDF1864452.1 bacillithiol system redox-active protein YtxJ [Saprospiraceae bacterium]
MNWIPLTSISQIDEIIQRSKEVPCAIFKHSTRCSISSMAKYRLEDDWNFPTTQVEPYFLDLIAHRDISAAIADKFSVWHESPQLLLIREGECTYDASHLDITVDELSEEFVVSNG